MTRRSDLMCEDLDECTHEPETPIRYGKTTGDLWSVYEGDTLLYAGEDRQRAFLLFGEAFHRRKEHVRLFRGTEVYAEGYSLKPEGG